MFAAERMSAAKDAGGEPIDVCHIGSEFLIFSKNASEVLEKYRICGAYIGSLARCPMQNQILGLPIKLAPEEALRLFEIASPNDVRFLDWSLEDASHPFAMPTDEQRAQYANFRDANYAEQVELFRQEKLENMKAHRDVIQQGAAKRKQRRENALLGSIAKAEAERNRSENELNSSASASSGAVCEGSNTIQRTAEAASDDGAFEQLLKKASKPVERADCLIEIPFHCDTLLRRSDEHVARCSHLLTPTMSDRELDRFCIFRHFHERGYYLTHATKFGGDFLVYEQQPGTCHSSFIVHCVTRDTRLLSRLVSSNARLANVVHKTAMYCYVLRAAQRMRNAASSSWWHMTRLANVQCMVVDWRQVDPAKGKETTDASVLRNFNAAV